MRHYRTHNSTEPTRAGLTATRPRQAAGTAAIAVLALFLVGCGDLVTAPQEGAYPRFSLTGDIPTRVEAFDVRVEGPDMAPIEEELTRDDGEITFEVPAGRDRTFQLLAQDDVYAARRTASLAPGRETTLDMDVYPGPVFPVASEVPEDPPDFVQIRDLGVDFSAVTDTRDGRGRIIDASETSLQGPLEFSYDSSGRLSVADGIYNTDNQLESIEIKSWSAWSDLRDGEFDERATLSPPDTDFNREVAEFDTEAERVAVAGDLGFTENAEPVQGAVYDYSEGGESLDPQQTLPLLSPIEPEYEYPQVSSIDGLSFDSEGNLWAVGSVSEDIEGDPTPAVIRYDLDAGSAEYKPLPDNQEFFFSVGDIKAVEDNVFVVASTYPEGSIVEGSLDITPQELEDADHPTVYRYSLDFDFEEEWGRRVASDNPETGEFWGPRLFAASRREGELIIIDIKHDDRETGTDFDGTGRLLRFEFDSDEGWQEFGAGEVEFFDFSNEASG